MKISHHSPVKIEYTDHHQHVHNLMAVEPIVKTAWLPALRHSWDVDDAPKKGQTVHNEVWTQRGGVAGA